MPRVFISYARTDLRAVRPLEHALQSHGIAVVARYDFSAQQAKGEIDKWIMEIEENQNDLYKLGSAAFAKKNFGEASRLFNESAEYKAQKLEEIKQKERSLAEEVVRDFRLAGDTHYNNYIFDWALIAYQRALTYVSRQQTPQLWAATLIDIGRANWELGTRTEGLAIAALSQRCGKRVSSGPGGAHPRAAAAGLGHGVE